MLTKEEIKEYIAANPDFSKEIFFENATAELVEAWVLQRSKILSVDVKQLGKVKQTSLLDVSKPLLNCSNANILQYLKSHNKGHCSSNSKRQPKLSMAELTGLKEKDLFMELIRDIAYELDVDYLSHKILVNVGLLTHCDTSSLFLVKGKKEKKYLVSRLFQVDVASTVEEVLRPENKALFIPIGVGIAGQTALTGETINIQDAYADPRFNCSVDKETGYRTKSILCMPIRNQDGEVIGVAQIINKTSGEGYFTARDEEVFGDYLTFCGIGLSNAQLFGSSVQEFHRNQVLLKLARNIFEDSECLDKVVQRIMSQALDLLECETSTVYILNKDKEQAANDESKYFTNIFHLGQKTKMAVHHDYWKDLAEEWKKELHKTLTSKISTQVVPTVHAGFAIMTAKRGEVKYMTFSRKKGTSQDVDVKNQIMNIGSCPQDAPHTRFNAGLCKDETMLCCPILDNEGEIIGVIQLSNKLGGSFDGSDEHMLEEKGTSQDVDVKNQAFAMFCGLGIHNTQIYEATALMLARQKVNMEILQYHACAGPMDIDELTSIEVPTAMKFQLNTFEFNDTKLTDHETCVMTKRMFLDFDMLRKFRIPHKTISKFILTVKRNYRPVKYHNWRHAFNVTQTLFALLTTGGMQSWFTELEVLVLLVACLCHDLDHRGTNNNFQLKSESAIAQLYSTSTMERHHFDHSVMILKAKGCNVFDQLSEKDYKTAMKLLEDCILATDLSLYFKRRANFEALIEQGIDWKLQDNRNVLREMMMTVCDLGAITKPWENHKRVVELVTSEFFDQGDKERKRFSSEPIVITDRNFDHCNCDDPKEKGLTEGVDVKVQPMMDRTKHSELPRIQIGFIDFVCLPLFEAFSKINTQLKPLHVGALENKKNWEQIQDNYAFETTGECECEQPKILKKAQQLTNHLTVKRETKKVSFSEDNRKSTVCQIV